MASVSCSACESLRENAPNVVLNGIGDTECSSLKNNTGLNPSAGNDNCTDLEALNDCLVGNMKAEVETYEVCDWKAFMKNFIPNVWNTFKGIICSMCGLWTKVEQHDCEIKYLYNGQSFNLGETKTSGGSYVKPGDGVSFLIRESGDGHTSDVTLNYIAGGLCSVVGSLALFKHQFRDGDGTTRSGNQAWAAGGGESGDPSLGHVSGSRGELLFEMRVNKNEFPQIKNFYRGFGQETGGGTYHFEVLVFNEGSTAYGYHGNGTDADGWTVPANFVYVQVRVTSIMFPFSFSDHDDGSGAESVYMSPYGFLGVRMNRGEIDC